MKSFVLFHLYELASTDQDRAASKRSSLLGETEGLLEVVLNVDNVLFVVFI